MESKGCSLCGAEGANKSTCPLNKAAKNPNYAKHNVASKAQPKEPKLKAASRQYQNIRVRLIDEDGEYHSDNYTKAEGKAIVDWYKKQIAGSDGWFKSILRDYKIKHIRMNIFEVSYVPLSYVDRQVIDPDQDSNHPIKLNGVTYLVRGREF